MMKKILLALLVTAALCYGAALQAQTQIGGEPEMEQMAGNAPPPEQGLRSIGDRFTQCMKSNACSLQVRMQIMQEENDDMTIHFQKIHQICADRNFMNCIDPQHEDVKKWHTANGRMRQIMLSMERQSLAAKEPSAGETPEILLEKIRRSLEHK